MTPSGYFFKKFGRWLKKSFDNLGDWMNKHDLSFKVGTNMTPVGGSRTCNASINGQEVFNSANGNRFNPAINVERGLNQMRSSYGLYTDNLNSWDLAVDQGIGSSVSMGAQGGGGNQQVSSTIYYPIDPAKQDDRKNGYVISAANGVAAYGFGVMGDAGGIIDSYGKTSMYVTVGLAFGYGASAGMGVSRTTKNSNVEDFQLVECYLMVTLVQKVI